MTRTRKIVTFLLAGAITLLLFCLIAYLAPLPNLKPYSLVVEDRNGKFIHAFVASDGMWRLQTHSSEIPAKLKRLLIRKEDRFFYYHPGINPLSLVRALIRNTISGRRVSGASTITMQVARMLEPKERTYTSKIIEMFRAFQLELHYSKNEILEMYLSMVPLGGNIEGIKSAALSYYQTPPERLNIAQLFDLILIPNDPNGLRPDRFPDRLLARRKKEALRWIRAGYFTKQDSAICMETPASVSRHELPKLAPHFALRVRERYPGSGEVRTALDLPTQRNTELLFSDCLRSWNQLGVANGAVLVLENKSRSVLAYVGSGDFTNVEAHGQIDGVRIHRSPGSTLKPFLYAQQFDKGTLTPKTRLLDTPYDAEGFFAENYDGKYSGLVSADDALRRSLNVPMIRLLKSAGKYDFVTFAVNAGFSSFELQKEKLGLSLIVGGCGVTLEELTAAYSSFPNGGMYRAPEYLLEHRKDADRSAFSPSAAYMVTDILSGVDRPDLPNNFESSVNLPKIAFKTGTSYGRRDAWAIGYSAEFTIGVWLGNVDHRGCPELAGGKAAAPLLVDLFNALSTRSQKVILPRPGDVLEEEVCATSGLLPTPSCRHTILTLYSVRHTQLRTCTIDREFAVSHDGKISYCPSCLGDNAYRLRSYEDYPPELLSFWTSTGKSFTKIPPHNPLCTRIFSGEGPKIVSPSESMIYYSRSVTQELSLEANSGSEIREHIWYVDDRFYSRKVASDKLFVPFTQGEHTVTCTDDKGRSSSVHFTIRHM